MKRLCIALLLLGAAVPARAAPASDDLEVAASLDREEVALDGVVTLEITVTQASRGSPAELQLPALKDFDVVSRSQSEQMSFALGGSAPVIQRTITYSVALTPHRAGLLTIEPARVLHKGKAHLTQALQVRVLPAGQAAPPRRGRAQAAPDAPDQDPFETVHTGGKDLVLKATVDTEKPYVGQQVTYSLYLLSRVNVSGIDKLQLPKMDGFWTEEVEAPQQLVGEARVVDGVPVQAYLLRKRALFPLRPGKVAIEPAEVEVLTGMGLLFSRGSVKRQTAPIVLDVQPLPSEGRPQGFDSGNVGQWSFNASVDPQSVAAGQPVTLRLTASGRGNLRDLQLPKLPAVSGLRAYDATTTDKTDVQGGKVGGTRTVEQLLVPERSGELQIPALSLEVFDPQAREYKTLRTQPLRLSVAAGAGPVAGQQPTQGQPAQNRLSAGGVRPIRLRLTQVSAALPPWRQPWFWPVLAGVPALLGLLLLGRRAGRSFSGDAGARRVKLASSAARKRLRVAEALLEKTRQGEGAPTEFYAEVARALTGYLADKQGLSAAGLTREELSRALLAKGHSQLVVEKLFSVLDECDRARFAPASRSAAAQEAVLQRADQVIVALDRGQKEAA